MVGSPMPPTSIKQQKPHFPEPHPHPPRRGQASALAAASSPRWTLGLLISWLACEMPLDIDVNMQFSQICQKKWEVRIYTERERESSGGDGARGTSPGSLSDGPSRQWRRAPGLLEQTRPWGGGGSVGAKAATVVLSWQLCSRALLGLLLLWCSINY